MRPLRARDGQAERRWALKTVFAAGMPNTHKLLPRALGLPARHGSSFKSLRLYSLLCLLTPLCVAVSLARAVCAMLFLARWRHYTKENRAQGGLETSKTITISQAVCMWRVQAIGTCGSEKKNQGARPSDPKHKRARKAQRVLLPA